MTRNKRLILFSFLGQTFCFVSHPQLFYNLMWAWVWPGRVVMYWTSRLKSYAGAFLKTIFFGKWRFKTMRCMRYKYLSKVALRLIFNLKPFLFPSVFLSNMAVNWHCYMTQGTMLGFLTKTVAKLPKNSDLLGAYWRGRHSCTTAICWVYSNTNIDLLGVY